MTPAISRELTLPTQMEAPYFHKLTERQKNFVLALLQYGAGLGNRTKCAVAAGYTGNENTLRVTAHRLFYDKNVQGALSEVASAQLGSFKLLAIDGIATLAENARDESVKLKALIALADRTGYSSVQQINVRHEDVNKTNDQILDGMVAMVMQNPVLLEQISEPRRSMVKARVEAMQGPKVIEAQAMEVDPDAELFGE